MADCSICSKGTVLDAGRASPRRRTGERTRAARKEPPAAGFSGPHVSAGPYQDEDGVRYEVRLERVPGGLRLAEWAGSSLRRRAPVLERADLLALAGSAAEALGERDAAPLSEAAGSDPGVPAGEATAGVSRGRAGDFREELRVEPLEDGRLRVGRWVLRPGAGWQLQDAPPMLPAARFAEAIADAVRQGLLSGHEDAARLQS